MREPTYEAARSPVDGVAHAHPGEAGGPGRRPGRPGVPIPADVPRPEGVRRLELTGGAGRLIGEEWLPAGRPRAGILLAHGGAQTRFSWDRAAADLQAAGFRVLTYDARGHGDSDWVADEDREAGRTAAARGRDVTGDGHGAGTGTAGGAYAVHAMATDLRAVVEQTCPDPGDPPVLVGASMGGLAALVALAHGHPVGRALVLVDVTPRLEKEGMERIKLFLDSGLGGFGSLDEVAAAVAAYQPHRRRGNADGLRKNVRLHEDGRWYWHWDPRFARQDLDAAAIRRGSDLLGELAACVRQPTLLIRGGRSDIVGEAGVELLRERIPHVHTYEVAEAGHMVAGDDNADFLGRLGWFLEEVLGV